MLKFTPLELLSYTLDKNLRYSMEELEELIKSLRQEDMIVYANRKSSFCMSNLSEKSCRILLIPFKDLPLLINLLKGKYDKKVYEWVLKKG